MFVDRLRRVSTGFTSASGTSYPTCRISRAKKRRVDPSFSASRATRSANASEALKLICTVGGERCTGAGGNAGGSVEVAGEIWATKSAPLTRLGLKLDT